MNLSDFPGADAVAQIRKQYGGNYNSGSNLNPNSWMSGGSGATANAAGAADAQPSLLRQAGNWVLDKSRPLWASDPLAGPAKPVSTGVRAALGDAASAVGDVAGTLGRATGRALGPATLMAQSGSLNPGENSFIAGRLASMPNPNVTPAPAGTPSNYVKDTGTAPASTAAGSDPNAAFKARFAPSAPAATMTPAPQAQQNPTSSAPPPDAPQGSNQIVKSVDSNGNVTYSGSNGATFSNGKGGYVFGNAPGTGPGAGGQSGYNPYDPYGVQAMRAREMPGLIAQYKNASQLAQDRNVSPLMARNALAAANGMAGALAQMPVGQMGLTPQQAMEMQMRGAEFGQRLKEANVKQTGDMRTAAFTGADGKLDAGAASEFDRLMSNSQAAGGNPAEMTPAAYGKALALYKFYNDARSNQHMWTAGSVPQVDSMDQLLNARMRPDGSAIDIPGADGHVVGSIAANALRAKDPSLFARIFNTEPLIGQRDSTVDSLYRPQGAQ